MRVRWRVCLGGRGLTFAVTGEGSMGDSVDLGVRWKGKKGKGRRKGCVMEVRDVGAGTMGVVVVTAAEAAVGNSEVRRKTWRASSAKEECP